jgi:hypothetical protein
MSTLSTTNLKNPSSGSNNIVLNADGTTTVAAPSNIIKSGTAVASTSGTAIDFTGIPSWVKRVTVMLQGVSVSGSSAVQLQIGSGSVVTSGYAGGRTVFGTSTASAANFSSGLVLDLSSGDANAALRHGVCTFTLLNGNTWSGEGQIQASSTLYGCVASTSITLSGTLDRVRITTVNGTDTFDAGSINILFEG